MCLSETQRSTSSSSSNTSESDTEDESNGRNQPKVCSVENCNAQFTRFDRFLRHIRLHTNSRPFKCLEKDCDKEYTSDRSLKRHHENVHVEKKWDEL